MSQESARQIARDANNVGRQIILEGMQRSERKDPRDDNR